MIFPSRHQSTQSRGGSRSRTTTEEQYLLATTSPTFEHGRSPTTTTFPTSTRHYRTQTASPTPNQFGTVKAPSSHDAPPAKRHSLPAISTSAPSQPPLNPQRRETPHDVALLELNARLVGGRRGGTNKGDSDFVHRLPGPFPATQQEVFDPYTGLSRGTLGPLIPPNNHPMENGSSAVTPGLGGYGRTDGSLSHSPPSSEADSTRSSPSGGRENELWDALARVRVIQSEVAKKHLAMEGLGGVKTSSNGGKPGAPKRRRSSRSSRDKAEIEDEFTGRKEAIDEIMKKLDELSFAVKGFHELPSPNVNLPPSSRASANSSFTTIPRPGPVSPSPFVSYYTTQQHSPPVSPVQPTSPRPSHSARSPLPPIIDSADEFESPKHHYYRSRGGYADSPSSTQASFVNY